MIVTPFAYIQAFTLVLIALIILNGDGVNVCVQIQQSSSCFLDKEIQESL